MKLERRTVYILGRRAHVVAVLEGDDPSEYSMSNTCVLLIQMEDDNQMHSVMERDVADVFVNGDYLME